MISKRSLDICLGSFLILQSAASLWAGGKSHDEHKNVETAAVEKKATDTEASAEGDAVEEEVAEVDPWLAKFQNQRRFDSGDPLWAGRRFRGKFGRLRSWNRRAW